ncbi:MAG TPA: ATP-binding cassette domain-containing protein [Candidatus Sulfotelmatobacter sp.]|jgi:NitT/TauT family transport system ATP-binding protein|nr:ATP-binding cassette domain-containing protein [Candidatus Sulfotelmatobacter sp.]
MSPVGRPDRLCVRVDAKSWPGAQPLLGRLEFAVAEGEAVALCGASGCGKSTLLSIAAGLDREFSGRVDLADGLRLSMVFQTPRLLPWRTAAENVALAMGGVDRESLYRAERMLEVFGLGGQGTSRPGQLSLGMARRVALARAMAVRPDVLLLDEAFVSLDEAAAVQARDAVRAEIAGRGLSVLMVSHGGADLDALSARRLQLAGRPAVLE